MLSEDYLARGVGALARAVEQSWPEGHFGCAAIAAWMLCSRWLLQPATETALQVELDAMIASRPHLFEPLPRERPNPELMGQIVEPLLGNVADLRHGGHDVIYAALALDALATRPELATPAAVQAIRRLIEAVIALGPEGDFYGVDAAEAIPCGRDLPPSADDARLAEAAFAEALVFRPMYYETQDIVGHLLTHSHALITLARLGYAELATDAQEALRTHARRVRLLHTHFDRSLWTPVEPAGANPLAPRFWAADREAMAASDWGNGHFFKFRYQFYDLLNYVGDEDLLARARAHLPQIILNGSAAPGRPPTEYMVPLSPTGPRYP